MTSLNNIITAVNTILALVGRSIPPIPTATRDAVEDIRSDALVSDDPLDDADRDASERDTVAESVAGTADEIHEGEDSGSEEAEPEPVADDVEAPEQDADDDRDVVAADEVDPDTASAPEEPSATGDDGNGEEGQTDGSDGMSDASQTDGSP